MANYNFLIESGVIKQKAIEYSDAEIEGTIKEIGDRDPTEQKIHSLCESVFVLVQSLAKDGGEEWEGQRVCKEFREYEKTLEARINPLELVSDMKIYMYDDREMSLHVNKKGLFCFILYAMDDIPKWYHSRSKRLDRILSPVERYV